MEPAVGGESLDGGDLPAFGFDRQHQARQHRLAIDQHRTGAALTKLAAVLGAGELQIFAQHFEQRLVVVGEDVDRFLVDGARRAGSS